MNPRIPEIVKNLANLIQELENAQENRESLEVLGRIKLYSAQLYLETDMEIIALNREDLEDDVDFEDDEFSTSEFASPEKTKEIINQGEIPLEIVMPISEEEKEEEEEVEEELHFVQVEEEQNLAETQNFEAQNVETLRFDEEDEIEIELKEEDLEEEDRENDTLEVEEFEMTEVENDHFDEAVFEVEEFEIDEENEAVLPVAENNLVEDLRISQDETPRQSELFTHTHDLDAHKSKAQEILGMFSLSRRFEFANLLFAGDMQQFILFLCEVLAAQSGDDREDVIDKWYEQNQWRRKDETASDLKRNLRKML